MRNHFLVFIFTAIFLLFFIQTNYAQNTQALKTPIPGDELFTTPDVKAFQSYNFLKPDLYTGRLNVEIPIFEVKSGGISVPISLTYNASGIHIDDYASNVGMGWNLNATGNVIRVIKDIEDYELKEGFWAEPDDDPGIFPYAYISQKGYFRNCYQYVNGNSHPQDTPQADWNDPCSNLTLKSDASPDFFMLNAPGISSKFYLEKIGANNYSVKDVMQNGYKYESIIRSTDDSFDNIGYSTTEIQGLEDVNWNIGEFKDSTYDYEGFNVTNTNGVIYSFGETNDVIENMSGYTSPIILSQFGSPLPSPFVLEKHYYDILKSTWHLDQIEDSKTHKVVTFNYQEYQRTIKDVQRQYTDENAGSNINSVVYNNDYCVYGTIPDFFNDLPELREANETRFKRQEIYTKYPRLNRIQTIEFDEGKVEFVYDLNRQDYQQDKALTQIIVRDFNDKIIQKVKLNYSYFISKDNCSEPECKRLKLDTVIFKNAENQELNRYSLDYYNPDTLPRVKSFEQDFLGYYNGNNAIGSDLMTPKLYFHANRGKYSILPFSLNGVSSQTISGDYNLTPNTNSLKGLLKTINYPTGGKSEFVYENHKFMLFGNQYTAGGARIKIQTIDNGEGHIVHKRYEYTEEGSTNSSGYVNNLPVYGSIFTRNRITNNVTFITYNKNKFGLELTEGAFVGYNRVIEKDVSFNGETNGYTVYEFTSPNEFPNTEESYDGCDSPDAVGCSSPDLDCNDFLVQNSSYPNLIYQDNDILRGKLISKKIFHDSNTLLLKEDYEYSHNVFESLPLNYNMIYDKYQHYGSSEPINSVTFHQSAINIERNLNTKKTTTEYLEGGNKMTEEFFEYNSTYPFLTKHRAIDAISEVSTSTYYPFDSEVSDQNYIPGLITYNRLSEPVKEEVRQDNLVIATKLIKYDFYGDGVGGSILPKSISTSKKETDVLVQEGRVDLRDDKMNVIQYTSKDGVSSFILWGYKKTLPIAMIKGASESDVSAWYQNSFNENLNSIQSYSDLDDSEPDEAILKTKLNNLRTAVGDKALITTYTYDPMVGATSMTDERGNTIYYVYDEFNRLQFLKDRDGNLLSENEYNYKN